MCIRDSTQPVEALPIIATQSLSPKLSDTQPVEALPIIMMQSLSPKLPDTQPVEAVPIIMTPEPPRERTVSNSAPQRVSIGGKEQRVCVFNSVRPQCREVEVSSECLFLNCDNRLFVLSAENGLH